ncbi:MAG TPA: aminotransferase class I/II-fold pyridoxal phosphate-dependent enzyme, partial [Propionibacteriaceae bacterium]|nr:aminotransferase class I/II-fold pyridoxal phosphate-dependent enzyme [Propionibacteriaceae bacterium]
YPPFFNELPQAGAELAQLPLTAGGETDLDTLEASFAGGVRILVLTNPHNPTGQIVPRPVLEQIADLCVTYAAWVLADEIHAHWSWRERPTRHGLRFQMQRVSAGLLSPQRRRRSTWQG